jgi:hypothetical protein
MERPESVEPQADHPRRGFRRRPEGRGSGRHKAATGKPDPRIKGAVGDCDRGHQRGRGSSARVFQVRPAKRARRGKRAPVAVKQVRADPAYLSCARDDRFAFDPGEVRGTVEQRLATQAAGDVTCLINGDLCGGGITDTNEVAGLVKESVG